MNSFYILRKCVNQQISITKCLQFRIKFNFSKMFDRLYFWLLKRKIVSNHWQKSIITFWIQNNIPGSISQKSKYQSNTETINNLRVKCFVQIKYLRYCPDLSLWPKECEANTQPLRHHSLNKYVAWTIR